MNYTSLETILKDVIQYNLCNYIELQYNGTRHLRITDYDVQIKHIEMKNTKDSTIFITTFSAKGGIWKNDFVKRESTFEKQFVCDFWKSYDELFDNDVLRSYEDLIFIRLDDANNKTIVTLDDHM